MSVNGRSALDPRWLTHHRPVSRAFQLATITVYNENQSARVYNAVNNTWDTNETAIWSGRARVQPKLNGSDRSLSGNNTVVQQVEMQLDLQGNTVTGSNGEMVDIRPGNYIIVSSSLSSDQLTKFVYIVRSVINSSNAWQRTLVCDVDMESDPNA
jgi:hypothetical protein